MQHWFNFGLLAVVGYVDRTYSTLIIVWPYRGANQTCEKQLFQIPGALRHLVSMVVTKLLIYSFINKIVTMWSSKNIHCKNNTNIISYTVVVEVEIAKRQWEKWYYWGMVRPTILQPKQWFKVPMKAKINTLCRMHNFHAITQRNTRINKVHNNTESYT